MSVINQMLRDLESRKTWEQGNGFQLSQYINSQSDSFKLSTNKLKLVLFTVIVIALVIVYKNSFTTDILSPKQLVSSKLPYLGGVQEGIEKIVEKNDNPDQQVLHFDEEFSGDAYVNSNIAVDNGHEEEISLFSTIEIQRIRTGIHKDKFRFVFESSHKMVGRVQRVFLENGLISYHLSNVRLNALEPAIRENNLFISHISFFQEDNDLVIELLPKYESISFYSHLDFHQGFYRLVIDVKPLNGGIVLESPSLDSVMEKSEPKETVFSGHEIQEPIEIKRQSSKGDRANTAYQRALVFIGSGDNVSAVEYLQKSLKLNTRLHIAREALAKLLIATGQFSEAGQVLEQGLLLQADNVVYAKMYGRILVDRGQLLKAHTILMGAEPFAEEDAEYLALIAAVAQRLSDHQHAVDYYLRALDIESNQGAWWVGMGISLEELNKKDEAKRAYSAAYDSGLLDDNLTKFVLTRIR